MSEFLYQGGYAGFVWGAFGMTFGLLVAEVLLLRHRRRTIAARAGQLARLRPTNPTPDRTPDRTPDLTPDRSPDQAA